MAPIGIACLERDTSGLCARKVVELLLLPAGANPRVMEEPPPGEYDGGGASDGGGPSRRQLRRLGGGG